MNTTGAIWIIFISMAGGPYTELKWYHFNTLNDCRYFATHFYDGDITTPKAITDALCLPVKCDYTRTDESC